MQRIQLRPMIAALAACAALALGCGDGEGGGVVDLDAAVDAPVDAAADKGPDAPVDASDATPTPDEPSPADAAQSDVVAPDAGVDADVTPPLDAPDVVTPDVVTPDVVTPDVVTPDVMPPVDVATDVGPVDAGVRGRRGTGLVSSGEVMRSPSYRMVSTLGQSSIHQTVMRSAGFRLRGGLVGATGGSR
jgi:hypothetical protein